MPRGTHRVSSVVHGTLSPARPSLWSGRWEREGAAQIRAVIEAFLQGWLEGDAEVLQGCLHPDLEKRLLRLGEPIGPRRAQARLRTLAELETAVEVRVLDVRDRMASALALVGPWSAYVHLARCGRRWTLVNVLWEWD